MNKLDDILIEVMENEAIEILNQSIEEYKNIMIESVNNKAPICSKCNREKPEGSEYSFEPEWLINQYRILCGKCKEEYELLKVQESGSLC